VDPEDAEDDYADTQYDQQVGIPAGMASQGFDVAAFAGVGAAFGTAIHMTGASFPGELDSPLSDIGRLNSAGFPAVALQGMPISSAGFDYRHTDLSAHMQQHGMAMSLDSHHGYTSPVSSTATITQVGVCSMDQILPQGVLHVPHDDLADMPFDMTFTAVYQ
jgi:hypothetical protein